MSIFEWFMFLQAITLFIYIANIIEKNARYRMDIKWYKEHFDIRGEIINEYENEIKELKKTIKDTD